MKKLTLVIGLFCLFSCEKAHECVECIQKIENRTKYDNVLVTYYDTFSTCEDNRQLNYTFYNSDSSLKIVATSKCN